MKNCKPKPNIQPKKLLIYHSLLPGLKTHTHHKPKRFSRPPFCTYQREENQYVWLKVKEKRLSINEQTNGQEVSRTLTKHKDPRKWIWMHLVK